jgi:predicted RNase H-like HicB family nuclease
MNAQPQNDRGHRKQGPPMYRVLLHRTEEGISVSVPALPGCWSEGDTEPEALANIQDAIRQYLAALKARRAGGPIALTASAKQGSRRADCR